MPQDLPSEFFVPDNYVDLNTLNAFEQALAEASVESDMQVFLERHPQMLIQYLGSGFRHWVIPKKRLGGEYETDFLIAERDTTGYVWHAVELERPQAKLFTSKGDPSAALTHALRQISDWRIWLSHNRDYATRDRANSGLGLTDIEPELEGLIIMGRERDVDARTMDRRRRLVREHRVKILTYDSLAEQTRVRLAAAESRINQNPVMAFVADIFNHPQPRPVAEDAVYKVFGSIGFTTIDITATRSEDWKLVYIDRSPRDEAEVALSIVYASGWRSGSISVADWQDWVHRVESGAGMDYSLLVTEVEPTTALKEDLTPISDDIWVSLRQPGLGTRSDLDMLVFLQRPKNAQIARLQISRAKEILLEYVLSTW